MPLVRRSFLVIAALGGIGCDQWKAPDRISALEARVNELSATVSVMAGRPVGIGKPGDPAGIKVGDLPSTPAPDAARDGGGAGSGGAATAPAGSAPDALSPDAGPSAPAITEWSYEGESGPDLWGEINPAWAACGNGKAQSPIEITPRASNASAIEFRYQPVAAKVIDSGAMLRILFAAGSSIAIDGRPYELVEANVHTPSEHVVAGEQYPMELQLIHKDATGKLAIIGVFYDVGPESKALAPVWARWPTQRDLALDVRKPVDPGGFLPDTRSVYRYEGSLTTPPCTESVVWNVMRRTMTESRRSLDLLRLRYTANARPLQPLNDRDVL